MSLVENLARRRHRPLELLHDIGELRKRGYSDKEIAAKTGLSHGYVHAIGHLLEEGEELLLAAVEAGQIPVSVAIDISEADEEGVQDALAQAYQEGLLRGKKLLRAKKDVNLLKQYTSERGKILPRRISGTSSRHQRMLATAIRRARHLALLPYQED